MGDRKYILAIDHGTSGVKTALVALDGEVVDFAAEPTPVTYLPGGGAEQDPEEWWRAFVASARKVLAGKAAPLEDVLGVGCSSTFSSTVVVDAAGRHLMPSLTWLDHRGAPHVQRRMRGWLNFQGYGLSKILRFVRTSGGAPTMSGKDSIAHMLFVQAERPEIYRAADKFLESKDWFNLRLTGRVAASFDSAMLFWATDTRNVDDVRWSPGLIAALGIDAAKLPPLRRSTEVLGPLLPEVADELGLPHGLPVAVGSPDLQSACVGSGAVRDYEGHIYLGTSSWVLCHVPFKKTDPRHAIASLPSAIPGRYFCANEQDSAGACLDFLVRNILFRRNALQDREPPADVYRKLDEVAAAVPPGSGKLLFAPWLNGEKTPVDDEALRGSLHNVSLTTTSDEIVRAVYEGVAYNVRWVLGHVERFVGRRLDPLHIVGGGAQSAVWCRIFADVLDRTIRQVRDPRQSNARGAAWIAAVALGRMRFDDIPGLIRIAQEFEPEPAHRAVYDPLFAEFERLYGREKDMYRRLNRGSRGS